MEYLKHAALSPEDHVASIYKSFDASSSRILKSFTNLSNAVIDTALSGQNKFIFEVLQNADDSVIDEINGITVRFVLHDGYFIIQHNGKPFDFYDVEKICDYASQIKEVKENDLGKTSYKGLGFKSLFNLSKCIYIYSGGYSFRFDKSYHSNPESVPWQVIPVWTDNLPLREKYDYRESVNFILKVEKVEQLQKYLEEILDQPESFLFLRHVNKFCINVFGEEHVLDRKSEMYENFTKYDFYKNQLVVNTWLSKTFQSAVPTEVKHVLQIGSKYTYPEKIKNATNIPITFTLKIDDTGKEIIKTKGLCFNTLPTQLHTNLPYHVNSFFILKLDRTQLEENEFNEFLFHEIGYLQLNLLKDLAKLPHLKNFVIELLTKNIDLPYNKFNKAFLNGFFQGMNRIAWLPSKDESRLLKVNEAWIDEILFFKENSTSIANEISQNIIDHDIKHQNLLPNVTNRFTYEQLFKDFSTKYYPHFDESSYVNFISYLYKHLKNYKLNSSVFSQLEEIAFLRTKNGELVSPKHAILDEIKNSIPAFYDINTIDSKFLPLTTGNSLHDWLALLGVKRLKMPVHVLRESLFKWIDSNSLNSKITVKNHVSIINYLAKNPDHLTKEEMKKLKEHLIVFTKSHEFKLVRTCYLPEAFPIKELEDVISCHERILPVYNMDALRKLLIRLGILKTLTPLSLFRKSILTWIKSNEINFKLSPTNYNAIVEYFASNYSKMEESLTRTEVQELRKLPVLTCAQTFQKADVCYFDAAVPNIPGFECLIPKSNLVFSRNMSKKIHDFFTKIGVSKEIHAIEIIRKSVLKWIQEGSVKSKINLDNHQIILKYIAEKWEFLCLSGLEEYEKRYFGMFPILTEDNTFMESCHCYWPNSGENIPNIESIIPLNNFAALEYSVPNVKVLLSNNYFGVRSLIFTDVYEIYCDHLTVHENIKWFFCNLISYWSIASSLDAGNIMLFRIKEKLDTSKLLAKNGQSYLPEELYSHRFSNIHSINPGSIPILDIEFIPEDLEVFLGFKNKLEMPCIMKLLDAFDIEQKNGTMNEIRTVAFFTTLLEQLRIKDIKEIKNFKFKLLSQADELKFAENLYYFYREDSTCKLNKCYLKRICGMSHKDTLELAKLCKVNVLPFRISATFEHEKYLDSLKKYYLERLPFIVIRESNKVNDNPSAILKKLYGFICSIQLFECKDICIQYPFGEPVKERFYFDDLKIYVTDNWQDYNSYIHKHLKVKLHLKADINDITDMQNISQKKKDEWIKYENVDKHAFCQIEKEIQNLSTEQDKKTLDMKPSKAKGKEDFAESFPMNLDFNFTDVQTFNNTLTEFSKQKTKETPTQAAEGDVKEDAHVTSTGIFSVRSNISSILNANVNLSDSSNLKTKTQIQATKKEVKKDANVSSIENLSAGASFVPVRCITEKSQIQRLNESYVFTLVKDYYKSKHPNAECREFSESYYTISWDDHEIVIMWMNKSRDKEPLCDIIVQKDFIKTKYIEVQSIDNTNGNSISINTIFQSRYTLSQSMFYRKSFRIFCVINGEDYTASTQQNWKPLAVYKIVPFDVVNLESHP